MQQSVKHICNYFKQVFQVFQVCAVYKERAKWKRIELLDSTNILKTKETGSCKYFPSLHYSSHRIGSRSRAFHSGSTTK